MRSCTRSAQYRLPLSFSLARALSLCVPLPVSVLNLHRTGGRYYRIFDVKKAVYEIDDLQAALCNTAQTQLKEVFGNLTFTEALQSQTQINAHLHEAFGKIFSRWGVECIRTYPAQYISPLPPSPFSLCARVCVRARVRVTLPWAEQAWSSGISSPTPASRSRSR